MHDQLEREIADILERVFLERAEQRIESSPREHCEAMAVAVAAYVCPVQRDDCERCRA